MIFNFVVDQYTFSSNILINYLAAAITGAVAYGISFKIIGDLYRTDIIEGKIVGRVLHWTIRFFVFSGMFISVSIINFIRKKILLIPKWVWGVFLLVGLISIVLAIVIGDLKRHYRKLRDDGN